MPAGCCGQFFSLSLPKKIISADVFLFHRCITISPETTITFFNCQNIKFPEKIRTVLFPFTCMSCKISSFNMLYVYSVIRVKHNHVRQLKSLTQTKI